MKACTSRRAAILVSVSMIALSGSTTYCQTRPATTKAVAPLTWSPPLIIPYVAEPPTAIETVQVSTAGDVSFKAALDKGEIYLLKATGTVAMGTRQLDAEYVGDGSTPGLDKVGDADVGIDIGVMEILPAMHRTPAPPSDKRLKWFGPARADHTYYLLVTGRGEPLTLKLIKPPEAGDAAGQISVSLYPLSPVPAKLGEPVETIQVPGREKINLETKLVPEKDSVWLLQAAGEVTVSRPNHPGDAEFMDYHADGTGFNEGEAGVDFGVGVDEPVVPANIKGPTHSQRRLKWGQYRMDHTYYMLYLGTGKPIVLNYHDSGGKNGIYGDNAGFLPVRVYKLP